ncbi:hypothetical protein BKP45_07050 [Anaerobacillus alkalidiazotrophicus]|uniref:Uncharacterized protein n=1 Tax=Anaerobacillus alkalidiazotrophicus TaxID=472963 RepID=A0A1S2MCS8_9BACI|nr:hypothetical protein [Anaerobacillus alkalidiazotrophicus]OIJ22386.1 hypothetical protein BKP45_07050 [Anaerobacillus alkalidiazotrophicus]
MRTKNVVQSIVLCEGATEDFQPVEIIERFTQHNHSVTVLVQIDQKEETTVRYHWYIQSEPKHPVAVYDIPLKYTKNKTRYVTNTLGIQYLFNNETINVFQPWFVLVEIDRVLYKVEFEIYESTEYHQEHTFTTNSHPSAYDFKV